MPDLTHSPEQVRAWLERVYDGLPGTLVIAHQDASGRFHGAGGTVTSHDAALERVARLDAGGAQGIYLRTTTVGRELEPHERGALADSLALPGLWADVDYGAVGHKPGRRPLPLPPDEEQARRIVTESGLPDPSLWVHSGGGLYPWWLLDVPLVLDEQTRPMAADLSTRWQRVLERSAAALGYDYGAGVGDLPRVLRVPGTVNRKAGAERPCHVVQDDGTAYPLLTLLEALTAVEPPPAPRALPTPTPAPSTTPSAPARDVLGLRTGPSAFDTLDEHVTFNDVLTGAGFTLHQDRHPADIDQCWTRPGDPNSPCSAHTLTANPHVLVVHSELAGLPTGGGQRLTRGRVFAHLHHGGDERAAALDLYAAIGRRDATPAALALPLPREAPRPMTPSTVGLHDLVALEHQAARVAAAVADNTPVPDEPAELAEVVDLYQVRLGAEVERLRIRDEAARLYATEKAGDLVLPGLTPLDEFLARPLPPVTHLVDGLWPAGGNVLLAAQWKAGKTTLRDNLVRSLVDHTPFLGRFATHADDDGRLALIDVELDEHTLQRWLRDQDLQHPQRVSVLPLRGKAATLNILDDKTRARWATMLADAGITRLVLDCLRPVLDALGLDEHREAGRFLEALDALGAEAGITDKLLVHHMGHGSERSRGDSRLLDWPDAAWKLTRLKTDDDPTLDDPAGPRFLSAFGRDVNVPEAELTYDHDTRHLTLGAAAGTRAQAKERTRVSAILPEVLAAIRDNPGIGTRALRDACKGVGRATAVDAAAKQLREEGRILIIRAGNSNAHTAIDHPVSAVSQRVPDTPDTCVRVSIDTDTCDAPTAATTNGTRDTGHSAPCPLHPTQPRPDACDTCEHHSLEAS